MYEIKNILCLCCKHLILLPIIYRTFIGSNSMKTPILDCKRFNGFL